MQSALTYLLLMGMAISSIPSDAAPPRPPVVAISDRPLVRDCEALFGVDYLAGGTTDQELKRAERREETQRRAAERRLSRISPSALRHRLWPLLMRLPVASRAYAGVAYTLAYFGVDTAGNVRRLGKSLSAVGADFDVAGTVPDRVDTLYKRHPSDAVLREYLSLRGDGVFGEDLDSLRGPIFLQHPRTALRLATQYPRAKAGLFKTLYSEWEGENGDTMRGPIRATLRRLSHDRDPQTAATAHDCLRFIHRDVHDYGEASDQ